MKYNHVFFYSFHVLENQKEFVLVLIMYVFLKFLIPTNAEKIIEKISLNQYFYLFFYNI